jgi:hypothetical protein
MKRRTALTVVLLSLLVATSGCVDLVLGNTPTFESTEANVSEEAIEASGYQPSLSETQNVTRNVSAAGQERTVRVTNHVSQYNRTISLGPLGDQELGRFVVFTSPAVEMVGQTMNPVADWSERRVLEEVATEYAELEDISHEDSRTLTILGEERDVEVFSGTTTVEDSEIEVYIHVTKFRHEDDFVVGIGVHPQQLPDEQERLDEMFQGVQH